MSNNALIDFYRGWMIEVTHLDKGFYCVCCSPVGEQLSNFQVYLQEGDAHQAAIRLIDRAATCHALKQLLREFYEQGSLSFADWQSLNQSLKVTQQNLEDIEQ